jgi:hypothetical protein
MQLDQKIGLKPAGKVKIVQNNSERLFKMVSSLRHVITSQYIQNDHFYLRMEKFSG